MSASSEKILVVDDDLNLLASFRRQFHGRLELVTTSSGKEALALLDEEGPFAVVVSDMRMPGMDGMELLLAIRERFPETVRIMLTGNANLDLAVEAVNQGNIFRFLTKPCEADRLEAAIREGVALHRQELKERQLLNSTLRGAVDLMTDILGFTKPLAFAQGARIREHVRNMVRSLRVRRAWLYELAAMLSHLGYIALPNEMLERIDDGEELDRGEEEIYKLHPQTAGNLLAHIPRLEVVAAMIRGQHDSVDRIKISTSLTRAEAAVLGGQMIKVASAYDRLLRRGASVEEARARLRADPLLYDPALVTALIAGESGSSTVTVRQLQVGELKVGMIIDENVRTQSGALLVGKGQTITRLVLLRLIASAETGLLRGTVGVIVDDAP